jgi:hypothetical protein
MRRTVGHHALIVSSAAGLAIALSSCGNATETGIEQLIESQGGGDVDLDVDGDGGFSMQTEEGGMTIDEDGNFVITDADGSVVTGSADAESGEFSVESEDGSFTSGATTELPEQWPTDVPEPDGLAITNATVIGSDSELVVTVVGNVDGEGFVEEYAGELESAGFEEKSTFTADGTINNVYSDGEWTVGLLYFGDGSENQATVSVYGDG